MALIFSLLSEDAQPVVVGTMEIADISQIRTVTYGRSGVPRDLDNVITIHLNNGVQFRVRSLFPSKSNREFLDVWRNGPYPLL